MGRRRSLRELFGSVALIALLAGLGIVLVGSTGERSSAAHAARPSLKPLGSCDHLRHYLLARPRALAVYGDTRFGAGGMAVEDAIAAPDSSLDSGGPAPPTGPEVPGSSTNVQEEGVDEPDIVKSNGSTIFSVDGATLRAVDVTGTTPALAGELSLPDGPGEPGSIGSYELILSGNRMLAIGSSYGVVAEPIEVAPSGLSPVGYTRTLLAEIDVSDPANMTVLRTATVEGGYVSARLTGTTARVVTNDTPAPTIAERGHGRALVPRLRLRDRTTGESERRKLVGCADVRRPSRFAGPEMLSVLTIDLEQGLPAIDVDSVMTNGEILYASTQSLYVASQRWVDPESGEERISDVSTEIHRFDITDPDATTYVASGRVEGFMLSQWSLSEHEGLLRVASTTAPPWEQDGPQGESESFVTVLATDPAEARLRDVGRVGGLGRGEQIYAVRFIGDTGYVVTFRQVDPLYTVDLSDPANPRVVGELKIPGYSAYLHPVGEGLLLGIGQDATGEGQTLGVHASLFDVSDPANPTRLDEQSLGGRYSSSEVEYDHHAFSFFPQHQLATVPVDSYVPEDFYGVFGLRIAPGTPDPLSLVAKVAHGKSYEDQIRRTLALGGSIYTVSSRGIGAHEPATLAQTALLGF